MISYESFNLTNIEIRLTKGQNKRLACVFGHPAKNEGEERIADTIADKHHPNHPYT